MNSSLPPRPSRSHHSNPSLSAHPTKKSPFNSLQLSSTTHPSPLPTSRSTPSLSSPRCRPSAQPRIIGGGTRPAHPDCRATGETATAGEWGRYWSEDADEAESSWVQRTASFLTSASREERGQAWLSARESSTSLSASVLPYSPVRAISSPCCHHSPPHHHHQYRVTSPSTSFRSIDGYAQSRRRSRGGMVGGREEEEEKEEEVVEADFLVREREEDSRRVRGLGAEEEGEIGKVVRGGGGGWVGWVLGVMEGEEEGETIGSVGDEDGRGGGLTKEDRKSEDMPVGNGWRGDLNAGFEKYDQDNNNMGGEGLLKEERRMAMDDEWLGKGDEEGAWRDAKWLFKVAGRIVL